MKDIRKQAGQVLVGGFAGTTLDEAIRARLARGELGGVILFARNVGSLDEVRALTEEVLSAADRSRPPWISVDQEGGRVARLKAPVIKLPPMRVLGEIDDVALTERAARVLGRELRALGFNWDFAPVLDVDTNPANPVIGDRSFSSDANRVAAHGVAFARGLLASGIVPCGKHFPGHGDTDLDSHLALPRLRHDRARLDSVELVPFRAAQNRIPTLMTAHVVFDAIDPDVPATLSRTVIGGLLRDELGYDGLVVSDDLEMKAVSDRFAPDECAVRAIAAGCDTVLVCSKLDMLERAHEGLVREAERSETFRARLASAAAANTTLRRRFPPLGAAKAGPLAPHFGTEEALAVTEEIESRAGTKPH
ncbi:MAG: beta-N-acetylhexosaminidase [Polyangiales bacterium]